MSAPLVSDLTRDRIRTLLRRTLQDTCDLYDAAATRMAVATDVACKVKPAGVAGPGNPRADAMGDRGDVLGTWRISLPTGTDVAPEWLIVMAADTKTPSLRGRTFAVVGDLAGSDEMLRRVIAVEGQGG